MYSYVLRKASPNLTLTEHQKEIQDRWDMEESSEIARVKLDGSI